MYLILKVTDRYGVGGVSEEIIGYTETLKEAEEYISLENPKLEFNESMGQVYYKYKKVERL